MEHDETANRSNSSSSSEDDGTGNKVLETEPKTEAGTTAPCFPQAESETITTVTMRVKSAGTPTEEH